MTNGATPSGSGSMPSASAVIVALPATRDLVDLAPASTLALGAHLGRQLGQRLVRGRGQPAERVGVHHRRADPGDHVAAERLLRVEHRAHRDRRAGGRGRAASRRRWWCRGRRRWRTAGPSCRRARRRSAPRRRSTAVTLKSAARSTVGSRRSTCRSGCGLEVVDRVEQPGEVGALVGQRRLVELDVALLHGRAQDHLAPDADGRRLGPGDQRRHLDGAGSASPGPGRPAASRRAAARP